MCNIPKTIKNYVDGIYIKCKLIGGLELSVNVCKLRVNVKSVKCMLGVLFPKKKTFLAILFIIQLCLNMFK